jgi:hypothetical protein
MVPAPIKDSLKQWTDTVIYYLLRGDEANASKRVRLKRFAEKFQWRNIAIAFDAALKERIESRRF